MNETLYQRELTESLMSLGSTDMAEGFLQNMLTPKEREELARRLQIFKMLKRGKTHRFIAQSLGVSIATVTRGARELKYEESVFLKKLTL